VGLRPFEPLHLDFVLPGIFADFLPLLKPLEIFRDLAPKTLGVFNRGVVHAPVLLQALQKSLRTEGRGRRVEFVFHEMKISSQCEGRSTGTWVGFNLPKGVRSSRPHPSTPSKPLFQTGFLDSPT